MPIYLQDYDPWQEAGRLAGLWGGKRLAELEDIDAAKSYADVMYGGHQPVPMAQSGQQPQVNQALLQATPSRQMDLWGMYQQTRPQRVQVTQPTAAATAPQTAPMQTNAMNLWQGQYQPFTQPVGRSDEQSALPGLPDKEAMRQQVKSGLGADYVQLVRKGFTHEQAKATIDAKLEQEMATQYNAALRKYQDDVLEPMRQSILNQVVFTQDREGNTVVDGYNTAKVKGMAPAVARYNYLAQQAGLPGIDMNNLNTLASLTKPNLKFDSQPNGDLLAFDGNTGQVQTVGNYAKPGSLKDNYIETRGGLYDIRNGRIVPGTEPNYTTGTSGYNAQILRAYQADFARMQKDGMSNEEIMSTPQYAEYRALLTSQQPATQGTSPQTDKVGQRINELRAAGWSPEEIKEGLRANGLERYESWVW